MNLSEKIVDLSFQLLRQHSAGHNEVNELLLVLQQLLDVETVGLYIWDAELTTVYPFGITGVEAKTLTNYVSNSEEWLWGTQAQSVEKQLRQQADDASEEFIPLAFPLWSKKERLGALAFLGTREADGSLLEDVLKKVNDFLLCVESVRKNRSFEQKSSELIQAQTSLENTLKISTSVQNQLEEMAAKLKVEATKSEKANKAKSEFLSSMSHELRTPLNVILGFSQLIKNSKLTEDQRENITEVLRAGDHLLDMVNEVLELSRIEAGQLEVNLSEIEFFDFINRIVVLIGPLAQKNNVSISNQVQDTGKKIITDKVKLKQILINLLSNAAKYNRRDGSVTIRSEIGDDESIKIEILDTGRGISDEHLEQAFNSFERLALSNGSIEGAGVGLAICKGLVESLGGKIGVESTLDKGSCFWITLPMNNK